MEYTIEKARLPLACVRQGQQLFAADEQAPLHSFLEDVQARLALSRKDTEKMLEDHLWALHRLTRRGLTLAEAMERLSPEQLSDFYLKERGDWYPLDTAAKVYPMSMSLKRMMLFRLSVNLKEDIDPALLQMALTYTIKRFPYLAAAIKCGFFWHYLDSTMCRYAVEPEALLPCAVLNLGNVSEPAFRVVYFRKRVSVECFHVLADGLGAIVFLRTLLKTYFKIMGYDIPDTDDMFNIEEEPSPAEWHDDFQISDPCAQSHGFAGKTALQMQGMIPFEQPNRMLHFSFSTKKLLEVAKAHGVTMSALLLGIIFMACRDACPKGKTKKMLQIQLPVNMRKFYPARTLRNFSMYCAISLKKDDVTALDDILPSIVQQMAAGTAKESLDQTMQLSRQLVKLLRFLPLIIKRPMAYFIYGALSDVVFTTTFSNLGVIKTSAEMSEHIEKFECALGPPIQNRACCALCSYGDITVFNITKNTQLPLFEDALYHHFCECGLAPDVEGSM